jgi:molybdopterin converting factor small subunit
MHTDTTMHITVHFLASLRHTVGASEETMQLPHGATLQDVIDHLLSRYPELDGQQQMWHFAVNHTHAEPPTVLRPGDAVSIFPYIAGG